MLIKCGICNKEIVVTDDLRDGQHVSCPFCGGKSAFSRPSRIELPTGAERRRAPASTPAPEPTPAPKPEKAKLKVIRTGNDPSITHDPSRERKIHMAEDRVKFYDDLKTRECHRHAVSRITSILVMVLIAAAAWVGYVLWNRHQEEQERTRLALLAEKAQAEKALFEEHQRQEKVQRELEAKRQEERLAQRKLEEEKRQEEARRREEERVKAEAELRTAKETYRQVVQLFRTGHLGFLKDVPEERRPGKVDGEFFYLLPFSDGGDVVPTVVKSTTNGVAEVYDLDANGRRFPRAPEGFLASLENRDYLVAAGDEVRFHSKRRKQHVGTIGKKDPVVLADEFFGDLAPEVRRLDPVFEELSFEVVFMPAGAKKPVIAKTVDYGMGYTMEEVREAICDAFPQKTSRFGRSTGKRSKYKRTVVFWDGPMVKRGIEGITYVPRVPPQSTISRGYLRTYGPGWDYYRDARNSEKRYVRAEHNRKTYEALRAEAEKQDREEAAFNEEQERIRSGRDKATLDAESQAYVEKIDRIIENGQMFFRARISEIKE